MTKMRIKTEAGMIEGTPTTLNEIALAFISASSYSEQCNLQNTANRYSRIATQIFSRLNDVGFYFYKDINRGM